MKILSLIILSLFTYVQSGHSQGHKISKDIDMASYKFMDKMGKDVSIANLKGKYVFIDVWASWCRPCINKFPAFDSLKVALKEKNIACIQVSIDESEFRWRNGMGFNKRIFDQWFVKDNRTFMKDLGIAYIPRYILLDRKGKVIDPKMEWISNPQMIEVLSKLKGI